MRRWRRWHRPVDRLRVEAGRLSPDLTPSRSALLATAKVRAALCQALSEQHGWPWKLALAVGVSPQSVNLHLTADDLAALGRAMWCNLEGCETLADCWKRLGVL